MIDIQLTLCADNFAHHLAALGLLSVLREQRPETRPRLYWAGRHAVIRTSYELSSDEIVQAVFDDAATWATDPVLRACDDLTAPIEQWRSLAVDLLRAPSRRAKRSLRFLSALIASTEHGDTDGRAIPSHLWLTTGQQRWLRIARDMREAAMADAIADALWGRQTRALGCPTLGWDADTPRASGAYTSGSPFAGGVPGIQWLAIRGMHMYPCEMLLSDDGAPYPRTTGYTGDRFRGVMQWPGWTSPLSLLRIGWLIADRSESADITWYSGALSRVQIAVGPGYGQIATGIVDPRPSATRARVMAARYADASTPICEDT